MLVIKYEKLGSAKFLSHLDMLRHIQRMLKRAEVEVEYSKGFNPHPLVFFAPPSPLGQNSTSEYCAIATSFDKEKFCETLNDVAIGGIKCTKVFELEKNPNLAGQTRYGEYVFEVTKELEEQIQNSFDLKTFEISFEQKGKLVTKEVRQLMHSFKIKDNMCYLILALGDKTLRIDRYLSSLGDFDLEKVQRTKIFVEIDGGLVEADEFLENLSK